jgi:hypothetical protein
MILREIITPKSPVITMRLPDEMVGKTVELLAFEVDAEVFQPSTLTRQQRLEQIKALTASSLIDLSHFKFDRDEANDYER